RFTGSVGTNTSGTVKVPLKPEVICSTREKPELEIISGSPGSGGTFTIRAKDPSDPANGIVQLSSVVRIDEPAFKGASRLAIPAEVEGEGEFSFTLESCCAQASIYATNEEGVSQKLGLTTFSRLSTEKTEAKQATRIRREELVESWLEQYEYDRYGNRTRYKSATSTEIEEISVSGA
ncbi:MAG: hypothetical protein JNN15_21665, partial [Blastocatellia bacterium]|nr:hypothetical protein [Blastocatellia bacterium]